MKNQQIIKNLLLFKLIELVESSNPINLRDHQNIEKHIDNLVILYKKEKLTKEQVKSKFYSNRYKKFFLKEVCGVSDKVIIDDLTQVPRVDDDDKKRNLKRKKHIEINGEKDNLTGFLGKFNTFKIDYYVLKLGFNNYAEAKQLNFDVTQKDNLEQTPIVEQILHTIKESHQGIFDQVQTIKESISQLSSDNNPSSDITKKINALSNRINLLKEESSDNFKILERNQNNSSSKLLENQIQINSLLENITIDLKNLDQVKNKIEQAKNEIISNQSNKAQSLKKGIKNIYWVLGVILLLLCISLFIPSQKLKTNLFKETFKGFKSKDSTTFKLIILPFTANKDCTIENAQYALQFYKRFNQIKQTDSLNIELAFLKNIEIPQDENSIKKMVEKYQANMIIWGDYEEECDNNTKMSLNYYMPPSNKYVHQSTLSNKSGLTEIKSIASLRKGKLQRKVDVAMFWTLAKYHYQNKELVKSLKALNYVNQNNFYHPSFYVFTSKILRELKREKQAHQYNLKIVKYESKSDTILINNKISSKDVKIHSEASKIAWSNIADFLFKYERKINLSIQISKEIVKFNPKEFTTWHNLGVLYYYIKDYQKSINAYKKALEIKPNYIDAWNNMGLSFLRMKKFNQALNSYNQCLKIEPDNIETLIRKTTVLFKLNKKNEFIELYKTIKSTDGSNSHDWYNFGINLSLFKEKNEAIYAYKKAIKLGLNNQYTFKAWFNIGQILKEQNKKSEARDAFVSSASFLEKNDFDNLYTLAILLIRVDNPQKSLEYIEYIIKNKPKNSKPDDFLAWNLKGDALLKLGKKRKAFQAYSKSEQLYFKQYHNK